MKIGIVVNSNDSETVWNALRFGNFALVLKGCDAHTIMRLMRHKDISEAI